MKTAREVAHSIDALPGMQCAHPGHTAKWHTRVCDDLTAAIEARDAEREANPSQSAREVAHGIATGAHDTADDCPDESRHGWMCDAIARAITAAITARDTEHTAERGNPLALCRTCFWKGAVPGCPGCLNNAEERRAASPGTGEREAGRRAIAAADLERIVTVAREHYLKGPSAAMFDQALLGAIKETMICTSRSPIPVPDEVVRREDVARWLECFEENPRMVVRFKDGNWLRDLASLDAAAKEKP